MAMRLGDRPPHPLTDQQRRAIKLAAIVGGVLIVGSILIRASYREMPGYVVGSEIQLSTAVEATVTEVHRRENEPYQRGDQLVTLENRGLQTQLEAVERDLDELTRSLAIEQSRDGFERRRFDLESSIATDQSELQTSRAELASVQQLLPGLSEWRDLSAERLRRGHELAAQDALTVTELDDRRRAAMEADSRYQDAVAKRVTLEARVTRLEQILGLERQRLGRLNEERTDLITELELKRREKEGERDEIQLAISRLVLTATGDGIVTKILRRPGELVRAGEPVLLVMRDEQLGVEAYLKVAEKKYVRPGDPVEVVAPAHSGTLKGRVLTVRPKLQPLPGPPSALMGQQNYVVLVIALDDPEAARGALSPAQEVTTRIRRRLFGEDQAIADAVEP